MQPVEALSGRTVFIAGSAKNAGKTTFLNFALSRLRPLGRVGFLSIGVDGEERDLVFGNPKPRVRAQAGDLLVTTDRMLRASGLEASLLEVFSGSTVLGRLVLASVRRGGAVELAGPEHNLQLGEIINALRARGAHTVLVDGAADRLTQIASFADAVAVHVVRVDPLRLEAARDSLRLLYALSQAPALEGLDESSRLELAGALTRDRLAALPREVRGLVLEDSTKVFLTWREWKAARARLDIRFQRRLELGFFCVVLQDLSRDTFEAGLEPELAGRILYNPYEAVPA
ncbi:MAG: hypothetical protein WC881_07690 [Elusimicrobiota bacterium]|jgi:hypothetical protein